MSLPFGTQQAFYSRVELVAPVDDWRASRCVARCPACCFFFADAVARDEQSFGAVVPAHGPCARLHCLHLHKAGNVVLSLCTLELVVTRDAVVKGAAKNCNNAARKLQRVLGCCSVGSEVRYRIVSTLYLVVGY